MSDNYLLENVYLFKGLSKSQLELIGETASLETFGPLTDIFNEGDRACALYIIKYGSVKISQKSSSGDDIEVAHLASGSHFGEMAMVDDEPRSATAVAVEKTDLIVLDYEKLQTLLKGQLPIAVHFYRELAHFLCGRLRITTNDLSFARERNLSHF